MLNEVMRRRKDEERFRQEGRMPPGQSLTLKFPVLHYGPVPSIDLASWDFRVWGEVEEEVHWTWEAFSELPRTEVRMDIHCVTRWSKFDTTWEGVSLRSLVDEGLIKLKPTASFVLQHCEHGFTANLPIEVALADNFLMATHFKGEPLTPEHGSPLRGVVGAIPGRKDLKDVYLWKGGKWLRGLEFMSQDRLGFWEQAGYHNEADIWKEQRLARGWF
ncbi:MAG TPA: molybdopterin-dependent oxidoreductase [Anaerolineae bacterium]|nr:molybdopterin-dependent oxidoreductase [Anaerolineae bacterium]